MKKFSCDFETVTWLEEETYVWAWAVNEIGTDNVVYGTDIIDFIEFLKQNENCKYYFHNLKFDGEFIIYYLLKNGYEFVEDRKDRKDRSFTCLISNTGVFYNIEIYFEVKGKKVKKATIIDSLKIIPFSVEETAHTFNLPISKLEIDYNKPRVKGHKLTLEEKEYIKNDVLIIGKALNIIFNQGLTKNTRASNALEDYRKIIGDNKFNHYFPSIDEINDKEFRKAYKGGFTYLNPIYKEKDVENVEILDVNSLYPSCMKNCLLPYGNGVYFEGEYKEDKIYPLYIQMITCRFEIKENKIPVIQLKKHIMHLDNEYVLSSADENGILQKETLVLTNIDLKLFKEHYNIYDEEYTAGWKFKGKYGLFDEYINKWIEIKNQATIEKNKGLRTLAKLMLNSLYGKFATTLTDISKECFLIDDIVKYKNLPEQSKKGLYIPIACFITAYARNKTITTAQSITDYSIKKYNKDCFVYS